MGSYNLGITGTQLNEFLDREIGNRYHVLNKKEFLSRDVEIYGFRIRQPVSDPYARVEYVGDNAYWQAAGMDFATDTFSIGDWSKAFFVKDSCPVMLYYTGKEAYKLNPDDFSQKLDGTPSDVASTSFQGNAMLRVPKTYWYAYDDGTYLYVWLSNVKITVDFECWFHHDEDGNEIPYAYMPLFEGSLDGNKIRSLSGKSLCVNTSDVTQQDYCNNNNPSGKHIWSCQTIAGWTLFEFFTILLSKSTHSQQSFGYGHYTGGSSASSLLKTGLGDKKGWFWGTNAQSTVVKILHRENPYGNAWKRVIGLGLSGYSPRVKLTYGKEDGSTAVGYSNAMTGYLVCLGTVPAASGSYIKNFNVMFGILIPTVVGGSEQTFYADYLWSNSGDRICYLGGSCNNGFGGGVLAVHLNNASGNSGWTHGAGLECRPKLGEEHII